MGSCTANALAAAFHFSLHKMDVEQHSGFKDFTPSRLFIYYNERAVEGSINQDAGAMLRDGVKVMAKMGVCPESMWKYDDTQDFFKKQPDKSCYDLAQKCKVKTYAHVQQDLEQMKLCIKNLGFASTQGFRSMVFHCDLLKGVPLKDCPLHEYSRVIEQKPCPGTAIPSSSASLFSPVSVRPPRRGRW